MTVTVLTAVLNAEAVLQDCLRSVERQKIPSGVFINHLVLDGGSQDGTLAILDEWAKRGTGHRFRSERDGGFYEALSAALAQCEGDIIGILNADDFYFDEWVLARVVKAFEEAEIDGVYGDLAYVTPDSVPGQINRTRHWKAGEYHPKSFAWGWMPPHPTIFVRKEVYARFGSFRSDFGTAADYEWLIRVMVKGAVPFRYVPHILVGMREGGMSNRTLWARCKANRNDRRAWKVNGLRPYPWTILCKPLRKLPQWLGR